MLDDYQENNSKLNKNKKEIEINNIKPKNVEPIVKIVWDIKSKVK